MRVPSIDRAFAESKGARKKKANRAYYFNNQIVTKKTDPRNQKFWQKQEDNK